MYSWDPRAIAVIRRLEAAGHQAVLVGGCVRDALLGLVPHDYDVATCALSPQTRSACAGLRCIPTGERHGTITVFCHGLPVEVTTFRREGAYSDHRRPDRVAFTTELDEDLARRDFTINALAWQDGRVYDPFDGLPDLQAGVIRCVGQAGLRLEEDALRLLRGLRLAAQLDFTIHPETKTAILAFVPHLRFVAWERICAEFLRLICAPGAGRILLEFPAVTAQILPELAPAVGFAQHNPHHCYDVYTHSVKAMEGVPPRPALRLAALLHDIGKPATFTLDSHGVGHFYQHPQRGAALAEQALDRLRVDGRTKGRVLTLIARHHLSASPSRRWVGRWLSRLGESTFFDLLDLMRGDVLACAPDAARALDNLAQVDALTREFLAQQPCLSLSALAVSGHDAMEIGLQGPAIGRALQSLLAAVAQGELPNQREILLTQLAVIAGEIVPGDLCHNAGQEQQGDQVWNCH